MFRLNILSEKICIEDVKSSQLSTILDWYNNHDDYYFATGNEKLICINHLWKKYQECLESPDIFFASIYRSEDNEPLGLIKGSILKEKKNSLWISVFFILTKYQKLGYGTESIKVFFSKIKMGKDIKTLYLSCSKHNVQGLRFWHKMGFVPSEINQGNPFDSADCRDIILMQMEI